MKKRGKEDIFTVLEGEDIIFEKKGGGGKNILFWVNIYPWLKDEEVKDEPANETEPAAAPAVTDSPSKKKKRKRDPNMPKQAQTAFFLFMGHVRADIKESNPDFSNPQIAKEASTRWKEMDEEAKKPFTDKAIENKLSYEQEMVEYKKTLADKH